ncbi:arylsulfatase [Akkermansiaceae bacterium]|nr:arylsulfatase [Akkermansiaceae bacterium]
MLRLSIIHILALMPAALIAGGAPRNAVFILADDLGWGELGCYGQEKIRTPNIDRLAAEGARFTHHYSGAPVCAPARCVLMTGKHLGHAEIRGNLQATRNFPHFKEGQHPITDASFTLAERFKAAGFATAAMGKWGLGPVGSTGDPNRQGFDLFFGFNCQALAHSFYPEFLWKNDRRVRINGKAIPGHARQPEGTVRMEDWIGGTYASASILEEALGFIDAHAEVPFFLYLPFTEPHVAMHPPIESVNEYPEQWDDKPYRGESGYLPHPRPRAGYAAMISDLDRHVGRVVAKLRENCILDETLIIFTSDNGTTHRADGAQFGVGGVDAAFFHSTSGLKGFKGSVYEGGLRVPMIVRYPPAVKAGALNTSPGYFADWFPTLCAAFGLEAPAGLDGENLWPAITGAPAITDRKPMVWVYPEYGGQVAVRIGDFMVLRRNLKAGKIQPWEAYDIPGDAVQANNLAAERPDLIAKAVEILKQQTDSNPLFNLEIPER